MASEFQQIIPEISSDPNDVKSHFFLINQPSRHGQARYRCRTCRHEFECSGRSRLIHHVTGMNPDGTPVKHVRSCPSPFPPLREALIQQLGQKLPQQESAATVLAKRKFSSGSRAIPSISLPPAVSPVKTRRSKTHEDELMSEVDDVEEVNGLVDEEEEMEEHSEEEEEGNLPSKPATIEEALSLAKASSTDHQFKKAKKVGRRPRFYAAGFTRLPKDRLLTIIDYINQLSPQIVEYAVIMEQRNFQEGSHDNYVALSNAKSYVPPLPPLPSIPNIPSITLSAPRLQVGIPSGSNAPKVEGVAQALSTSSGIMSNASSLAVKSSDPPPPAFPTLPLIPDPQFSAQLQLQLQLQAQLQHELQEQAKAQEARAQNFLQSQLLQLLEAYHTLSQMRK